MALPAQQEDSSEAPAAKEENIWKIAQGVSTTSGLACHMAFRITPGLSHMTFWTS